jgi:hypothetical protein
MKEMYDIVSINVGIKTPDGKIPAGSEGTIVHKFSNSVYMIEFVIDGKNFVETVTEDEISDKILPRGDEPNTI